MPSPGDVYFHTEFKFEDGNIGRKLIVVLNKKGQESLCLVLKTTSQVQRYIGAQKGCNPNLKVFFVPLVWQQFKEDTYIQLLPIYPLTSKELIQKSIDQILVYKFTLTQECLSQLLNCLKKHFRKDLSDYFYSLIFK